MTGYQQPNSRALFGGERWPSQGAYIFASAEDCLAFMFGPADHDAHVRRRHHHLQQQEYLARLPLAEAACRQLVDDMIARERARRVADAPALAAACAEANREFEQRQAFRRAEIARLNAEEAAR